MGLCYMEGEMCVLPNTNKRLLDLEECPESNNNSLQQPCKRQRSDNSASAGGSPRFKGVVLQQNGHWGAQIYANHSRTWLGTFKSEQEAAMAYDSAALKLRSGDPHRNFPITSVTMQEPMFQEMHSWQVVVNMIKDGSYQSKFMDFVRNRSEMVGGKGELNLGKGSCGDGVLYQQLFQKDLTPSDVGKLNRLVIPKKYAVKHFPKVCSAEEGESDVIDDMELVFYDKEMRSWKFRYCYWKSSQSYVFTRGWSQFVKAKKLKENHVITFYKCEHKDVFQEQKAFWMIDVESGRAANDNVSILQLNDYATNAKDVEMQLGSGSNSNRDAQQSEDQENVMLSLAQPLVEERKSVRLFGIEINLKC